MSPVDEDMLLFAFPEGFSFTDDAATPGSGGQQKKAGRQRRRRKARQAGEGDDPAAKKRKLSDEQAQFLEMRFREERKLETPRKVKLAAELGLDTKQVAVWFQNRRARYKSKLIEEEFSKLRAAHDAVVVHNCHLETELLKLKDRLAKAEAEEERTKFMAVVAASATGGGVSCPSSPSFSTVTNTPPAIAGQFGVEEMEADLTYLSEYDYNDYMMDLAAGGYFGGGLYEQYS